MIFKGPVVEFLDYPPVIISAGHDGFLPYDKRPFDELFIIAKRFGNNLDEHSVELWLPYGEVIKLCNTDSHHQVRVHKSGFLWHDRTRDITNNIRSNSSWLSRNGFTPGDPRKTDQLSTPIFAILPGSPMTDNIMDLLRSHAWRRIRDFHTRHRSWMVKKIDFCSQHIIAKRYERDKSLTSYLKLRRGSACQICGFTFTKKNGTDYCEVHHLEWLAHGGLDVLSNMLVLCANCHRCFHYGNINIINHTPSQLIVDVNGTGHSCQLNW